MHGFATTDSVVQGAHQDRFAPRPGTFGDAQRPLDVVQIDHTKLDIIVVDREQRLPIGRPWITLAIDVYSRMVVGFCISLDPPGAMSTGYASRMRCCPKKPGLRIAASPAAGRAGAFRRASIWTTPRSSTAKCCGACEQYGIALDYRPPATPAVTSNASLAHWCVRCTSFRALRGGRDLDA